MHSDNFRLEVRMEAIFSSERMITIYHIIFRRNSKEINLSKYLQTQYFVKLITVQTMSFRDQKHAARDLHAARECILPFHKICVNIFPPLTKNSGESRQKE